MYCEIKCKSRKWFPTFLFTHSWDALSACFLCKSVRNWVTVRVTSQPLYCSSMSRPCLELSLITLIFRRTLVTILEIAAFVSTDTHYVVQVIFPSLVSSRELSLCVERNFISVLYVQPIANFIRILITPRNLRMSRNFSSRYVNPAILHSIHWRPNVPSLLQLHIADLALWSETLRIILSITTI